MTAEEAIEMFERVKHGAIYLVHQRIEDNGKVRGDFSLCDIAIDALKKQVPMKMPGTHTDYKCAVCGRRIRSGKGSSSYKSRDNFCQKCGQAIDWSEDNQPHEYVYRISTYATYNQCIHTHPVDIMEKCGFDILRKDCQEMLDLYWFKTANKIDNIPDYIVQVTDYEEIPTAVKLNLEIFT